MRVPLYAKSVGLIGWILLGPRPDGSFYGKDERDALLEISGPTARALMIATTRRKREMKRDQELTNLRATLASLQKQIGLA